MVELIPKKEQKPVFGQVFILIVSFAVLVAVTGAFFLLQQLGRDAREVLVVLEKRFVEGTRPLEEALAAQLQHEKEKTEILREVLGRRKDALVVFKLLEETTHPGVFFRSFAGDVKTGKFTLDGEARNFVVLEQQRQVWGKQREFSTILSNIRLGEDGRIDFGLELTLKHEILGSL